MLLLPHYSLYSTVLIFPIMHLIRLRIIHFVSVEAQDTVEIYQDSRWSLAGKLACTGGGRKEIKYLLLSEVGGYKSIHEPPNHPNL